MLSDCAGLLYGLSASEQRAPLAIALTMARVLWCYLRLIMHSSLTNATDELHDPVGRGSSVAFGLVLALVLPLLSGVPVRDACLKY